MDDRMQKLDQLIQNEEFAMSLFSIPDPAEAQKFLSGNGLEFSIEEIIGLGRAIKCQALGEEKLSEETLSNAAGGAPTGNGIWPINGRFGCAMCINGESNWFTSLLSSIFSW